MSDLPLVPNLSSDRPISSLSEDTLGRGGFAVALANAFIQWRGDDSLVVALYGPWGSGKSSMKNMVLELIRRHGDEPAIVEFNPWAWSGRDRIFGAFFEEVGIALGKGPDKQRAKALATRWRKFGARLSFAGIAVNAIKMGTQAVGIPVAPLVLEGVATGAKRSSELADGAAKAHQAASEDEPLEELKRSLADSLSGLKAPLMVVMDDVDRLTKEEVRTLFQVIKANADFPRVVYFLLFDRAVVEKAVDGEGGSSGRDYMEKIVQAGFDMPKHDQADLDRMLCDGLTRILDFEAANRTFDAERWGKLLLLGLRPILSTPRDVKRFLSSVSFTVGLFFMEGSLEVNVIDMLGIEALRVFEPHLFNQLRGRRDLLLGGGRSYRSGRDDSESAKQAVERLIEVSSEAHRTGVRAILQELFPQIDWLLRGYGQGDGFGPGWMRNLRICHKDLFDRYFALAVPEGDVPISTIDRLLSVLADRDGVRRELRSIEGEGRLVAVLNRLASYTSELDLEAAVPFVTALMDIGDSLPDRGGGMFGVGPDMTAYFILYNFLKREPDTIARSRVVLESLAATEGLYLPIEVVSLDEHRRTKGDPYDPPLLDDVSLARAKRLCIAKLVGAAGEGRLVGPKLGAYLWRWKRLAGDAGPRRFVSTLISTLDGSLQFLRAVTGEVRTQPLGGVTVRVEPRIDVEQIEEFVPVPKLRSKLRPLLAGPVPEGMETLAAEYRKELTAFLGALDPSLRATQEPFAGGLETIRIDLNTATIDELSGLPGIDRGLATRIVEGRPYENVEAVSSVRGIGEKKLSRIRRLVRA